MRKLDKNIFYAYCAKGLSRPFARVSSREIIMKAQQRKARERRQASPLVRDAIDDIIASAKEGSDTSAFWGILAAKAKWKELRDLLVPMIESREWLAVTSILYETARRGPPQVEELLRPYVAEARGKYERRQ